MADQLNRPTSGSHVVIRLSFWQAVAAVVMAVGFGLMWTKQAGVAALLGGLVSASANLFFAGRLYMSGTETTAQDKVYRFYRSETMKIVFTISMFIICLVVAKVQVLPFIIAYLVGALIVNWIFLLV